MPARALIAAAAVGVVAIAVAFTQIPQSRTEAKCEEPRAEPLDPASSQHLLPGQNGTYPSAAPTSGAHRSGQHPTGVLTTAIPRAVQVALLEGGGVIVQYRHRPPSQKLVDFVTANEGVTLAPNRDLEASIVATAWQYKMQCIGYDEKALQNFVDAHLEKAHGH